MSTTLDHATVADDEALGEAVDAAIHRDAEARARLYEIADLQEALRGAVDALAWQLVLRVDEMSMARWADLSVGIAKWAFDAGRQHTLLTEEGSS
jgi:hypothetical protein